MRTNCLLFALALWWRRQARCRQIGRRCGIAIVRSHWGPFPHVMYTQQRSDGHHRLVGYAPLIPRRRLAPPPLFRGRVVWGDRPAQCAGVFDQPPAKTADPAAPAAPAT